MKRAKNYQIKGELTKVSEILSNLKIYGNLHPLIESVEKLDDEEEVYTIYEKPFSWLPINLKYRAKVTNTGDLSIKYLISEIPLTTAIIEYDLTKESKEIQLLLRMI